MGPMIMSSESFYYLSLSFYLSVGKHAVSEEMEPPAISTNRSSRRLLFDRRYGWVVDEWKDPSDEALAGGRGMFCVVPLGKALFQTASLSINSAVKFLDMKLQTLANPLHNSKSSLVDTSGDSNNG